MPSKVETSPSSYEFDNQDGDFHEDEQEYELSDYKDGSIVRVTMENFVTYSKATFFPGPYLNMVIGPNGTGKSTLVCAICIGLGFKPDLLGRAKELSEFVKRGTNKATVEIELKGTPDNIIIHRTLIREGAFSSDFKINGRRKTAKEVATEMKRLNIQIDNLCQFLPQDRVVEFAQMNPRQLLVETQRAVCDKDVQAMHEALKDAYGKLTEERANASVNAEQLKLHEKKLERLESEVERFREKQKLKDRIKLLEDATVCIQYSQAAKASKDSKQVWQEKRREKKNAEEELAPVLEKFKRFKIAEQQCGAAEKNRKAQLQKLETYVNSDIVRSLKEAGEKLSASQKSLNRLVDKERDRRKERKALKEEVNKLERRLAVPLPEFDIDHVTAESSRLRRETRDFQDRRQELENLGRQIHARSAENRKKKLDFERRIEDLTSVEGQRMQRLYQASRDTYTAWEWLERNKHELGLKGTVEKPPLLCLSVTDPRYVDHIEAIVGSAMKVITCTNYDDMILINQKLLGNRRTGERGLMLKDITLRCVDNSKPIVHPISREDLNRYGFDGWALDFVEAPEIVIQMLCGEGLLQQTAVALRDLPPQTNEQLQHSELSQWITGRQVFTVARRREYGVSSTRVNTLPTARLFNVHKVDENQISGIRIQIAELDSEYDEYQKQVRELKMEDDKLAEKCAINDRLFKNLQNSKTAFESEKVKRQKLEAHLQVQQQKLDGYKNSEDSFKNEKAKLRKSQRMFALEASKRAVAVTGICQKLASRQLEVIYAELQHAEAISELEFMESKNAEVTARIAALQSAEIEAERLYNARKEEARRAKEPAMNIINSYDEEKRSELSALAGEPMETVEAELAEMQSKLSLSHDDEDPALQRNYEQKLKQVEALKSRQASQTEKIAELENVISETRGMWEPKIDDVVNRISKEFARSFESIKCAGEVRVHKEDDFSQWAIEIMVKFRSHEPLQVLNAQRQSGGERAVSTIFYLMSLQQLALAPFRVVDEINQGMDAHNEKMVHARMVEIACQTCTSQYFLITPKLLQGLRFHERMKVHCINSGVCVEEGTVLDWSAY